MALPSGGLDEPVVVPRFLEALKDAGATPTRVHAYTTRQNALADDIAPEAALMRGGCISAIIFTSTAEAQGLVTALGGVDVLQALVAEKRAFPVSSTFVCFRGCLCGRRAGVLGVNDFALDTSSLVS
jgi:hypothetical protein